jgi:hypothetical protein
MNHSYLRLLLSGALCLMCAGAVAEQSSSFGDYTVHYNAFTTDILTPEVAKAYGIQRSKSHALLNISVLKKVMGTTGEPVRARVQATATNLSAQLRQLNVRELIDEQSDSKAIYYLAETPVTDGETLKFSITVTPAESSAATTVTFDQQFFTN